MARANTLNGTIGYLLGKAAQASTALFASKVSSLGLRPKHCGLLAAIASTPGASQQSLGRSLGVVPSAVGAMLDDLETVEAIRRVEAPADRRSHAVELTWHGTVLLTRATELAREVDAQCLGGLAAADRTALESALRKMAANLGLAAEPAAVAEKKSKPKK